MTTGATLDAKPVVVLRVPEEAMKSSTTMYYAGFQVSDDANDGPSFYTTSLQVTVTARRFSSTANWKKSLVQPNFTAASNIKALTAPVSPAAARTAAPTAAEIKTDATAAVAPASAPTTQWGNSLVTGAIPGQVVGFTLPDKCRIDEVLTVSATTTPLLDERGSYQGSTTTGSPGAISFMVPLDAAHGETNKAQYFAALKIMNDSTAQWLAVSVEL